MAARTSPVADALIERRGLLQAVRMRLSVLCFWRIFLRGRKPCQGGTAAGEGRSVAGAPSFQNATVRQQGAGLSTVVTPANELMLFGQIAGFGSLQALEGPVSASVTRRRVACSHAYGRASLAVGGSSQTRSRAHKQRLVWHQPKCSSQPPPCLAGARDGQGGARSEQADEEPTRLSLLYRPMLPLASWLSARFHPSFCELEWSSGLRRWFVYLPSLLGWVGFLASITVPDYLSPLLLVPVPN